MQNCPYCSSKRIIKRGSRPGIQKYQCRNCEKYFKGYYVPRVPTSAKILLLDIETAPGEYYSWSRDPQYLSPEMMIKDWSILCWSAKWLFEPTIMGETVKPKEAINRTEESILEGIWKLMNEAQIVVTQNGIKFDIKRLETKFIKYGYNPPSGFVNVDTLKVAKERFSFTYNSLEELGRELLGIEDGKIKMKMSDWKQCVTGSQEYLDKMLTYCKNDVAPLLEDVYLRLRPWIKSHPNLNLYTDHAADVCPKCESNQLSWSVEYATPQGLWDGFRCLACGSTGRGTSSVLHRIKYTQIKPT